MILKRFMNEDKFRDEEQILEHTKLQTQKFESKLLLHFIGLG